MKTTALAWIVSLAICLGITLGMFFFQQSRIEELSTELQSAAKVIRSGTKILRDSTAQLEEASLALSREKVRLSICLSGASK